MPRPFDGAVLAGGGSTRMGADKAGLTFAGAPLIAGPVDALAHAEAVRVIGGDPAHARSVDREWVADDEPGSGPLGGIRTALRSAGDAAHVVVLACDLPFITAAAVERLVDAVGTADVCTPIVGGRRQWVASVWRRACVERLDDRFRAGERSVHGAVGGLSTVLLLDLDDRCYLDVDTPEDLAGADPGSGSVDGGR